MSELIKIDGSSSEFLLDTPIKPTETVAVFLPGISGGAFSDRFQPIADACLKAGFAIARIEAWKNADEVESKNLGDIYRDVGYVTTYLHHHGYTNIVGIGKSFGGAVMLLFPSVYITKMVLWAPAVGVVESGANIGAYTTATLGTLHSLLDLHVDKQILKQKGFPVLIIHGTADENIPFSNSEKIISMLPNAKLVSIEGADHSYKNKVHEDAVIKATMDFLKANLHTQNPVDDNI